MPEKITYTPPSWVDKEAWDAFVEMRKAKGKRAPFTEAAAKRIVLTLDRLRSQGHPPEEVLWQSTMAGWSGVFPLKTDYAAVKQQTIQREQELQREKEEITRQPIPESVRAKIASLTGKMRAH
jgi:hypothetical protein